MTRPDRELRVGPDARGRVVRIAGGRIVAVDPATSERWEALGAPAAAPPVTPSGPDHLDAAGARIVPGAVNAHTHVYSGLAPFGIPPPEPPPENFVHILERLWWRLDRALDEPSLEASARWYVAEALLAGTSTLVDHHESPGFLEGSLDVLADVCEELGIRAVLCFGATERNGGREEARRGLAECRRFIESEQRPGIRGLVALHASFTVSDETVREAAELCRELGTPLHVHLAEDVADVADARERGWAGPLERLLDLDALPPGSILAHGVHLDAEQVRRAADAGCWLVQNPRSNRGNRVGYPQFLAESSRVALGTDGYPARLDDEAAALHEVASEHGEDPGALERRIEGGWTMASELFGLPFAPLAEGGAADLAVCEPGGDEERADRVASDRVRHLVVGGRVVVRDGELLTGDVGEIRAAAEREATRLWARMRALP